MRILIRTSKWAIWARRLGSLAIPLAVISVLMHRERLIPSSIFHVLGGLTLVTAGLAVVAAIGAFVRLWFTGDRGWGRAVTGLVLGLACLAPVAYGLAEGMCYPRVVDVTTDSGRPLLLTSNLLGRQLDAAQQQAVAEAFPNLQTRRYAVMAPDVFDLAVGLATARGWDIRQRREPVTSLGEGQLNAVATTLLGWRSEAVIRVAGDAEGSTVDMRSTSLAGGVADLGDNGRRIEEFLLALDEAVSSFARDNAQVGPAEE